MIQSVLDQYLIPNAPQIPVDLLVLTQYSFISRLLCYNRVKISSRKFNIPIFPNLYSLVFMPSNSGKDFSQNLVAAQFAEVKKAQKLRVEDYVRSEMYKIDQYLSQKDENGKSKFSAQQQQQYRQKMEPYSFLEVASSGTEEGFFSHRKEMEKAGFGSFNFHSSEFIDYISRGNKSKLEFLDSIKDSYETGNSDAKIIKGDKTPQEIEGAPVTVTAYSSIHGILDNSQTYALFLSILGRGYSRRSFILFNQGGNEYVPRTYEEEVEAKKQAQEILEEMLIPMINEIDTRTWGKNVILKMTDEADHLMHDYEQKNLKKNSTIYKNLGEIFQAEVGNRFRRAVRLSACIAMFQHPNRLEITAEDYQYAVHFTEYVSDKLFDLLNLTVVSDEQKIYQFIKGVQSRKGFITKSDIVQSQFAPKYQNLKYRWYEEIIPHLSQYCEEQDETLEITTGAKNRLEHRIVPKQSTPEPENPPVVLSYTASTAQHPTEGYKPVEQPFLSLHKALSKGYCYSPAIFSNGYRKGENVTDMANAILIDIDDTLPLEEAKKRLTPYASLIITTQNHQKDKNGVVADRYRIIIPTLSHPSPATYKETVQAVLTHLDLTKYADIGATTDKARYFKPSPKDALYWYSPSKAILPLKKFQAPKLNKIPTVQHNPKKTNSDQTFTTRDNQTKTWRDFDHLSTADTSPVRCIFPEKHKNGDKHPSGFIGRHTNGTLMFKCTACQGLLFET